jgi:hypothetical protein
MSLTEKLKALGNNSDEVAESLRKEGIKGKKQSKTCCPIINYLHRDMKYKGLTSPVTGVITWDDPQTLDPLCPETIHSFMVNFDSGMYPDLIG